jgi:hypothetical protein
MLELEEPKGFSTIIVALPALGKEGATLFGAAELR